MKRLLWIFCSADQGQDVIEYALMAGLVAIAAGALMPNVSSALVTVCSKIESLLADAASY
jgi:pilus assembly protein Flp/PilA